jgi:hypothetical protein
LIRAAECTEWAVTESRAAIMIEDTQESRDRLATAIALHAETAKLLADHRAKMLADYRKTEVGE